MSLTPEEAARLLGGLDLAEALAPTLERIVFTVEGGIKRRTPVDTGALRRSVHGQVLSTTEGVVGTNLIYARPVHRQNPYMERGLQDVEGEVERILAEGAGEIWSRLQ